MSEVSRKTKLSALLAASLISANFVCAGDAYKNNVVDVKVNKEAGDAVKVTIYTDRPYTDPVVVNKKANNKYVILMPETNSALKSTPTVTNGSGTISNVTVNTQSVSGGKGYTKIVITSEKAINVVPRTQQVKGVKHVVKPSVTTTKLATDKPVTTKQSSANKVAEKSKQTPQKQTSVKPQQKKTVTSQPTPVKQVKPVQPAQPKVVQPVKKQPIEILEQEVKTGQYANVAPVSNDEILKKEIDDNLSNNEKLEKKKIPVFDANNNNKSVIENIKAVLKDYQNINIWKMLLLAGAITFPIIVIFVILALDKKINKKIDKSFKREEEYYRPESEENFERVETTPQHQTYSSFDDMLDDVNEPELSYHEEHLADAQYEEFTQKLAELPASDITEQTDFNNDFVMNDFETEAATEDVVIEPEQAQPVVPIEPKIVEEAIEEPAESEAVVQDNVPIQAPEIPSEPYNPDGYLSDFAGVNDNDFFDELAIQTMADNNKDGLPSESPADEVFNFMTEEEPKVEPQPEAKVEQETEQISSNQIVKEETPQAEPQPEAPQYEYYSDGEDELTMLKEVKLNDNAGMYLVNYDNFSSLVGHIDDDYFVIKKFDEIESGRIFVKETEKLKDVRRYLVRVGRNKMVVEVSDTSMSKLMDL